MDPTRATAADSQPRRDSRPLVAAIERRTGTAFLLAGTFTLASVVVPVGLSTVTDLAWTAGLALVGLAVLGISVGISGLSRRLDGRTPLARIGTAAAGIAGLAALGLVVAVVAVVPAVVIWEVAVPKPMGLFRGVALVMAGGFALGFLLLGVAYRRAGQRPRRVGPLLVTGGAALSLPVLVELVGPAFAVQTPGWLLGPVLGLLAIDSLAVGYAVRATATS